MATSNNSRIRENQAENVRRRVGDGLSVTPEKFERFGYAERAELYRVAPERYRALLDEERD